MARSCKSRSGCVAGRALLEPPAVSVPNDIEANKRLVREYFAAVAAGDLDRIDTMMHDDLHFWVAGGIMGEVVFRSPAELRRDIEHSLTELYDPEVGLEPHVLNLTAEQDRVVAEVVIRSRSVHTKDTYENPYVFLFWIRDGKFARIHEHLDTDYVRHRLLVPAGIAAAIEMPWLDENES